MISCQIIAPIETYYILKEPLNIGDATIFQETQKMFISAAGQGSEKDEARNDALDKIRKACLTWSLRMYESLRFNDFLTKETYTENGRKIGLTSFSMDAFLVKTTLEAVEISDIKRFSDKLKNNDEYGLRAATYFERALLVRPYKQEAFLNFYKVSELIFEKIFGDATDAEIQRRFSKAKSEVSQKDKIAYMCEVLGISPKLKGSLENLVDVRNRYDVGHARLAETDISNDDFNDCRNLALGVILSYLRLST